MKRDMELIRLLLLDAEGEEKQNLSAYSMDQIRYHYELLNDAGYLIAQVVWTFRNDGGDGSQCVGFGVDRLTWKGHEFLDKARNDKVWKRAKAVLSDKAMTVSVSLLSELLQQIAKQQLGIP